MFEPTNLFTLQEKKLQVYNLQNKGNIYMNIGGGPIPSSTIYLKIKGSEKAKWSETRTVYETVPGSNPP